MIYYRKNFGSGKLQSSIGTGDLTVVFQAGHTFPTVNTDYFKLIIWNQLSYPNPANDPMLEIVTAHYVSGNMYVITRAEEGTLARAHDAGSTASLTLTAGLSNDDLYVVGSARVDESNKGNGRVLVYDDSSGVALLKYANGTGVGDMLTSYWDSNGDGKIDSDKISVDATSLLVPIASGGTGQTTASGAINALLPTQTSNSGKFLTTNGSVSSWGSISVPTVKTLLIGSFTNSNGSTESSSLNGLKDGVHYFPIAGTLKNLYTTNSGNSTDIIIQKNGSNTDLKTTGAGLDSVNTVSVSVGDYISVSVGRYSVATWVIEFDPS